MKVLQINALYGNKSTGTIMRHIHECCFQNGIDSYVSFSYADRPLSQIRNAYQIGNLFTAKLHALLSRIGGKQAYFSHFTTFLFLAYLKKVKPDIVHLHNLHNNYIHLNILLDYLARNNIITIITMHDCWYFTGGCTHYTHMGCFKWQQGCGSCPLPKHVSNAYIYDSSKCILRDRKEYLGVIPHLTLVGCSKWIANECRQSFLRSADIRVIHNGFDLDIFRYRQSSLRSKLGIHADFVILGPAIKWLLPENKRTLDYFLHNMPSSSVMVLFGCRSQPRIIDNRLLTIGYITSPVEMAELYSMADVFVNCSREDTLSSLNLEAQACGTPVVTYDATGSKETVDGLCGFAIETGNYELLHKTVLKVKEIGKHQLSQQCISWISKNFEMRKSYMKYIELYRELYSKKNKL